MQKVSWARVLDDSHGFGIEVIKAHDSQGIVDFSKVIEPRGLDEIEALRITWRRTLDRGALDLAAANDVVSDDAVPLSGCSDQKLLVGNDETTLDRQQSEAILGEVAAGQGDLKLDR